MQTILLRLYALLKLKFFKLITSFKPTLLLFTCSRRRYGLTMVRQKGQKAAIILDLSVSKLKYLF